MVVAAGADATPALVFSQVVLSLALPVPMVALVVLSARRDIMGVFVSTRWLSVGAGLATAVVLALNVLLIAQIAGLPMP